jgi:hypothetical protein
MSAIDLVDGDQAIQHSFKIFPLWQNGGSVELQFCNCKTVVPLSQAGFHRHFYMSSNVLSSLCVTSLIHDIVTRRVSFSEFYFNCVSICC